MVVSVTSALSWAQLQAAKAAQEAKKKAELEAREKEKELKEKLAKEAAQAELNDLDFSDEKKKPKPDNNERPERPDERPGTPDLEPLDDRESQRPQTPSNKPNQKPDQKPNEKPDQKPNGRPSEKPFEKTNDFRPTTTPPGSDFSKTRPTMEGNDIKPKPKETFEDYGKDEYVRPTKNPSDNFEKPEPRRSDVSMIRPTAMPVDQDKKALEKLQHQAKKLENSMSVQFYEMAVRMAINNLDSMVAMAEPLLLQIHEQISRS